jgi:hypothetical protein
MGAVKLNYLIKYLNGITFAYLLVAHVALAGGEVENGGDSVFCDVSGDNQLVGYFSLDYLLTYRSRNDNADVIDRSWEESRDRISRQLHAKLPALGRSFDQFVALLFSTDSLKERIWHEASFGLEDISDERILRKLPPNCYKKNAAGIPEVIQSVIRVRRPEAVIYEFDPDILADLEQNSPLQFSFLVVHEWLWDFTGDVQVIRDVNRLLHSSQLEAFANPEELVEAIANLGISLSRQKPMPICMRTEAIRVSLEKLSASTCDLLGNLAATEEQILQRLDPGYLTYPMELSATHITSIKLGDFSGLSRVGFINLAENEIGSLHGYDFAGLMGLQTIYLGNNAISNIEINTFRDLPDLRYLSLTGNQLTELPKNFLSSIRKNFGAHGSRPGLEIFLTGNPLRDIPDDLCSGIQPQSDDIRARTIEIVIGSSSEAQVDDFNRRQSCVNFRSR